MKYLNLMFLVLVLGASACEGTIELGEDTVMPQLPAASAPKGDSPADTIGAPTGETIYQQKCGSCHGADATGGASYGQSILGFADVETVVVNGSGIMPPIPMTATEIEAVQTFLMGGSSPTAEPETTPVNDGTTPALQVYASKCAGCHGAEGAGTQLGPTLRLRDAGLTRFTVRQGRNGAGIPTTMPVYATSEVTDSNLEEIIDWLDAFPNPTTGEGLYNQYCSTCHGATGTGGTSFKAVAGTLRAKTIIRSGHGGTEYAHRADYMTAWTPEQISDEEIVLIEQYMREL